MEIIDVEVGIPDLTSNVQVAVPCGNRTYLVNCFALPTGKIRVGSVLFVSEVRPGGLERILEDADVPSFQKEVADLQGLIGLVRDWHAARA